MVMADGAGPPPRPGNRQSPLDWLAPALGARQRTGALSNPRRKECDEPGTQGSALCIPPSRHRMFVAFHAPSGFHGSAAAVASGGTVTFAMADDPGTSTR